MFRNVRRVSAGVVGLLTAGVLASQVISPTVASAAPLASQSGTQDAQFLQDIRELTTILPAHATQNQEQTLLGDADYVCSSVRMHVPGTVILNVLAEVGAPEGDLSNPLQRLTANQAGQVYGSARAIFCPERAVVVVMGEDGW